MFSLRSLSARSVSSIVVVLLALGCFSDFAPPALAIDTSSQTDVSSEIAPAATPVATDELLIFLRPGQDAVAFGIDLNLKPLQSLRSDRDAWVFSAASRDDAAAALIKARADVRVRQAWLNERTAFVPNAFVPNDPYFHRDTPAPGWPGQWHLINEHTAGLDSRVQGAWNRDITGAGVVIGIVDDSFETTHPDLAPNYMAADSWDFGQNDAVPDPVNNSDRHGVSVAGVAAARGGNGIGLTGAAPFAGLAGLRIDFITQTTAMFVDATLYHSSGVDTQIAVKNHSYGYQAPYIQSGATRAATTTSAAAGTVHCLSAGNNRGTSSQDSNKLQDQSSPDVICVAALGSNGTFSSYSNFGACVMCTAPSSSGPLFGITTTDRTTEAFGYNGSDSFPDSDYTSAFGGTSSASPLVAGVMGLVKQAQPGLNVRWAKHLLVRTCDIVDAADNNVTSDGGWRNNAAGYHINQDYGFGLIDADELTLMAAQTTGVTPRTTATTGVVVVDLAIPDNNTTGITQDFAINPVAPQPVEEVTIAVDISHTRRGQIEMYLTSPSGTTQRVVYRSSSDTGDDIVWTYCCNGFWGESAVGTWSLQTIDVTSNTIGTWNSFEVTVNMGDLLFGTDCNTNGTNDADEITGGAPDCNNNGALDECELAHNDCNANGVPDDCDLAGNDCNTNAVADDCDIASLVSADINFNLIPDECEPPTCTTCVGDLTGDGLVDGDDTACFVARLLSGVSPCGSGDACADMNGDLLVDGVDASQFVAALLTGPTACP